MRMNVHSRRQMPGVSSWKDILGIPVASVGLDAAIRLLRGLVAENRFTKVAFLNAHNANLACTDPQFAEALSDFLMLSDGVGVDIAAKLLYGEPFPANLNGTDFIPAFLAAEPRPLTIGLLGTKRAHAEAAAAKLTEMSPHHSVVVIHDGYFTAEQEPLILERIEALRPDILLVAMGVPRQEFWIAKNITSRHCTLPIAVGALLDFLSGMVPRAPVWMRRLRLEWVFRLVVEPGRLWRRYVLGNPVFLARVMRQKLSSTVPAETRP
jgi:exopolysaccharide biosynthesis WecB/TagA/CpsF family protein